MVTTYKVNYKRSMAKNRPKGRVSYGKKKRFENAVKRVIRKSAESKFRDVVDSDTSFVVSDSSLIQSDLLHIDQGDGVGTRDGNKIWLKGIHVKGRFAIKDVSAGTDFLQGLRMLVVHLPDNVGLGSDSLNSALANGTFDLISHYPRDTDRNYKILYDKLINFGDEITTTGVTEQQRFVDKYIKIGKPVYYDGATGSTDLQKGDIVILLFTETAEVSRTTYNLRTRVFFKDLD